MLTLTPSSRTLHTPSLPPSCVLQHIAHYWLGVVAAKRGLFDEAKDALQNALFYNPSYFPAMLNLGGLLIVQGYLEQGLYAWHALAAHFAQSRRSHAAVACCCCLVWLLLHLCPVTTTRQLWRGWSPKMSMRRQRVRLASTHDKGER